MALPPIVKGTLQSAVIGGISNLIAQIIAAQQANKPVKIDTITLFQFILFALVSTPPNILWQEFLESTFPAYSSSSSSSPSFSPSAAPSSTKGGGGGGGAKAPAEPKLNKLNTAIKTLLDQTLGAFVNTLMFSMFMHGIQAAMAHASVESAGYWDVIKYENVDWQKAWAASQDEFWGIVKAGWRFWPLVSAINFVFLKTVEARNLVGGLAGLGWGVYISLSTRR